MKFRLVEKAEISPDNNQLILYHNTPYSNIKNILKNGLSVNSSRSELSSGVQMTWALDHPYARKDSRAYGGCTVIFKLPKGCLYEKVNDDQYLVYDDVPPDYIIDIDYFLGNYGNSTKTSNINDYIAKYGADKVRQVLLKDHNPEIPLDELKQLTPQLGWDNNEIQTS